MKNLFERISNFFYRLKIKIKVWYENSWFYRYIGSAITHPRNFVFCLKYPFWKSRNVWTGKFMGYNFTWYDSIPDGWKIAFGKDLTNDIVKALKSDNIPKRKWCKNLCWQDVKEKYGELRLYASATEKVQNILEKYETMSIGYCICCGKPARYVTQGYVTYLCENCFMKHAFDFKSRVQFENYKLSCRLTKKDIPKSTRYEPQEDGTTKIVEVDYKKEYGIDFEGLWSLK